MNPTLKLDFFENGRPTGEKGLPKMVLVTWEDSAGSRSPWLDNEAQEAFDHPFLIYSLGWLVRWNKKRIILAQSLGENALGDLLYIPKGCILEVREVRRARKT